METRRMTETEFEIKEDRKQFPLKSEENINAELKRHYQNYIELDSHLPDWPSQKELLVSNLF